MAKTILDAVYGCLIGGAIGDAMGAPVEGWTYWEIREKHGRITDLLPNPRKNSNQLPGGITDDTALRTYIALAIIRKQGRITPDDLAALWVEKGSARRFWANERAVTEKLTWAMDPWDTGRGADQCGTGSMAIAPVGIINAGDSRQAFQDGFNIASVNQDGAERAAAGTMAAGVAHALLPGATVDSLTQCMFDHGNFLMKRAIDLTMDVKARSASLSEFVEKYYVELIDWFFPRPLHRLNQVPPGYPKKAMYYSGSSLEMIPVSLALMSYTSGDVNEGMVEGTNFGRDCDTIASIIGCLAGALQGASAIRREWIETTEANNHDLFEEIENDPSPNFRSQAERLVGALQQEQHLLRNRISLLDGWLEGIK
jgi:ADP-ribosylglycohydrolase